MNVKPTFIINANLGTYHMGRRIFALKTGSRAQNSSHLVALYDCGDCVLKDFIRVFRFSGFKTEIAKHFFCHLFTSN